MMRCYGRASIAELLGDLVIYRGLRPAEGRLPGLAELRGPLGFGPELRPRKGEPAYAQVVAAILRAAQTLQRPGSTLSRLVLIGDTRMSDGGAFSTLRDVTGWEARALICSDEPDGDAEPTYDGEGLWSATRWAGVRAFAGLLAEEEFVNQETAVVLDLDKTLLGARGRNHALIDQARVTALRATVAGLLGDQFDEASFAAAYAAIDRAEHHPFTGDNQDNIAYICLMIGAGELTLDQLLKDRASGRLASFPDLISQIDAEPPRGSTLATLHRELAALVRAGDPTPFKAFRRREFRETAALLGTLPDDAPPERMLREELVLTAEVFEAARRWREAGALLIGLSDKPDEAALPAPDDATPPLHRIATHVVGEA